MDTKKALEEVNKEFQSQKATLFGMSRDEQKTLAILMLCAALLTGLLVWIF